MMKMRDIEPILYKGQEIITTRSPTNIKEVQQLTCHLATMSHFLSYEGNKAFIFFDMLNKKERFEWIAECDEAFTKVKNFLTTPLSSLTRGKSRYYSCISQS